MGAGKSKSKSPPPFVSSNNNEEAGSESNPVKSFHEALVRERSHLHEFSDIYETMDLIGQGGICKIYKIKKKDAMVGGSSREENVARKTKSLIHRYSPRIRPKTVKRGYSGDTPEGAHVYFALKVINLALVKEDSIDQLKNEVEILKSLDHTNIINAYETFQEKPSKKLMIVMELCTGGDLHARLPYTEQQAASVTKQIVKAISYLHSKSIIHRDIKFENVIFESAHPEAVIKVIDFGLSKKYSPTNNILTERGKYYVAVSSFPSGSDRCRQPNTHRHC
jgi:serine/threonine protein kinase